MSASAARAVSRIATRGRFDERRVAGERAFRGVGLHSDHAHRVRDLVVQLAGDPRTLLCNGRPGPVLTLALQLLRELFEHHRTQPKLPDPKTREHRRDHHEEERNDVPERLGAVRDTDQQARCA